MVREGKFTVELVDGLSKSPYKEHKATNGRTYVEVEPNCEYFIRVGKANDGATCTVMIHIEVDGERIGNTYLMRGEEWVSELGLFCPRQPRRGP
jgi:hypothetical protein